MPALQAQIDKWRTKGRPIKTTKDLLECYYSSITVVRILAKGRYMLIDEQVEKLHTEIVVKCCQSHYLKRKVRITLSFFRESCRDLNNGNGGTSTLIDKLQSLT